MTALAILAKEQGSKVTGSDTDEDFPTREILAKFKITPLSGFRRDNLINLPHLPDLVVTTGAHGGLSNPEVQAAKEMGLRVLLHGQALSEFMEGKKGICVAGSHGKTTVAAMIAHILFKNGLDPSFAIGCGSINSLGAAGHEGQGDYFVAEADEYVTDPGRDPTPRFFWLNPTVAVITNIDFDHPDAYRNIDEVKQAFLTFAQKLKKNGLLVAGIDNENVKKIIPLVKRPILTFGFSPMADFQISRVTCGLQKTWFNLKSKKIDLGQFSLSVPGKLNVVNATAAGVVANYLGISWLKVKETLTSFSGTKRRFEFMGTKGGVNYFDDYAHHPCQIKNTLEATRDWFPDKRIICVFQPHTYSRTKALFKDFAKSFTQANVVILTDIYPSAREEFDPTINSRFLSMEIKKHQANVHYLANFRDLINFLEKETKPGDIVMTMGAGDIYKIHDKII